MTIPASQSSWPSPTRVAASYSALAASALSLWLFCGGVSALAQDHALPGNNVVNPARLARVDSVLEHYVRDGR